MKGLSPPHLLLASGNPIKMIHNLNHLLSRKASAKLTAELDRNVVGLFDLGISHYKFAIGLTDTEWRQKISRLYYAVYNVRRAVMLKHSGVFSTDSSDHLAVDKLPDKINNHESHKIKLRDLREDRNLSDYSHQAKIIDLVIPPSDALAFSIQFIDDCRKFLQQNGVNV